MLRASLEQSIKRTSIRNIYQRMKPIADHIDTIISFISTYHHHWLINVALISGVHDLSVIIVGGPWMCFIQTMCNISTTIFIYIQSSRYEQHISLILLWYSIPYRITKNKWQNGQKRKTKSMRMVEVTKFHNIHTTLFVDWGILYICTKCIR